MDRPDFGLGQGGLYVIRWTERRLDYLRHCAERRMSAADIAEDIGLQRSQGPRIQMACKVYGIKLSAKGGRPARRDRIYKIFIPPQYAPMIQRIADRLAMPSEDVANRLVASLFQKGDTFVENLLGIGDAGD
jgi:hypothetical protein